MPAERLSPAKIGQIQRLAAQKMSMRNIATRVGVSVGVVAKYVNSEPLNVNATALNVNSQFDRETVQAICDQFEDWRTSCLSGADIETLRDLHIVALFLWRNGVHVRYNPVPLIMAVMEEYRNEAHPEEDRELFRLEAHEVMAARTWMDLQSGARAEPTSLYTPPERWHLYALNLEGYQGSFGRIN
jgi:AcrR family transcriptional regulator